MPRARALACSNDARFARTRSYSQSDLSSFLMIWGNTYGLMLVVLLMGNGLIEMPRKFWRLAHPAVHLARLQFRATLIDSELYEAQTELHDAERVVERMHASVGVELKPYINIVLETCQSFRCAALGVQ